MKSDQLSKFKKSKIEQIKIKLVAEIYHANYNECEAIIETATIKHKATIINICSSLEILSKWRGINTLQHDVDYITGLADTGVKLSHILNFPDFILE
ncbi:hypothetical protein D4R42_00860 [bacterium]|nr:MAG: hypothetical protein D4R42_00860 [bacterium]